MRSEADGKRRQRAQRASELRALCSSGSWQSSTAKEKRRSQRERRSSAIGHQRFDLTPAEVRSSRHPLIEPNATVEPSDRDEVVGNTANGRRRR
jgi:hypothetical protein